MTDPGTLANVLLLISTLACLGWSTFGFSTDSTRTASRHFCAANFLLVLGDIVPFFRDSNVSFVAFYQTFNGADLLYLGGTVLFRSGMRELHGLHCTYRRDLAVAAGAGILVVGLAHAGDLSALGSVGVYGAASAIALMAVQECYRAIRPHYSRAGAIGLLWPVVVAGVVFGMRALDGLYGVFGTPTVETEAQRLHHFNLYLWSQLVVLLLVNASLIAQTVDTLIHRLHTQASRLQNILDVAPVGVAVSSEGIIRFANPRITELIDMKVGDAASNALVVPEDRSRIVQEIKSHGVVNDLELQMYCPNHTVRDLQVTYMPTDHEGKPGILAWMIDITERKRTEKRILFNRTVVENSEPMFWADPHTMTVAYANQAALALIEATLEQVIGSKVPAPFLHKFAGDDGASLVDTLRDAARPLRFETRYVRSNSVAIDVDVSCYIAEDDERSLIIASMRDITDQKRAERALRQASDEQSAIFEAATIGIAFIKDSIVVRANHKLDELFGWDHGELVGKPPQIWLDESVRNGEGPYTDIKAHGVHFSTQELYRKDGSRIWCRLSGSAIDMNDLSRGTVWMMDDVTAERIAAQTMRQAKELAEDATRMKSDFLANMSHEIRTPMNAIIGMSHLALKTDLDAKQRNYIEKVDSAARNLLGIINDILDFSKIEAGKMQFESAEFHLEDVMENLADLSVIKAQDKGLELLFDIAPDVPTALVGDSLRLGQVLLNLVGNAIKFTERGEITVAIRTLPGAPADHIKLQFDISDTGVGLSEDQRNKLFSAFSQADASTTRKYGGTGLGLTISKRLVELMQGDISVQSHPGLGSTFSFTGMFGLQIEQRPRLEMDSDVADLRILVVDDNARAREIMLAILESQKFKAHAVHSGTQALAALEEAQAHGQPYGLVLMDWMMPEMDGLSSIQRIRADPSLHHTPAFVMVTAHSRDELLEQAQGTKIDGLLLKPVGPSALLDSILTALGKDVVTRGRKHQRQEANQEALQKVRGAYLLLVEDNLVNQELALEIMQGAGIRVDVANNGAEAVAMVEKTAYDGVLMDCQMPVMDGFEATRLLRANERFATLPILAMTANAMSGDKEQCLAAGMNDHIGKPIDVNQLFNSLAKWVVPSDPANNTPANAASAPSQASDSLPAIAGLDIGSAMRRMDGNVQLMRKLITRFVETQSDAMQRIQEALRQGDTDTATREAHTVKGLAGNIGASQVMALAGNAESALRKQDAAATTAALQELAQALAETVLNIRSALTLGAHDALGAEAPDVATAQAAAPLDLETLGNSMRQLAELLAEDDARSAKLADSLAADLRNAGQGAASSQLQKLISKYEFESALDKLREIAQALSITL
ncbi:PAS domain-containing hybrid sensor histidine kinase/response regulator [Rhodoferax aquaticus]|uniref:Sensory/regulatory protein RpfC n=1 Tax=Rhodoferax aquaticus TaxID=2527691 RepID=A0A515EP17_9BURK|nr:PAS domain-containing hybrid sensor histidine kinase/response regulator [Rhodoferax aquaticus]QDL54414.1 PAS domain-containing sensor histidine kinase [Rhodoferax aquaticus]